MRNGKKQALTLVETISITGLIALILLFTMALIPSAKLTNRRANMELQAGVLAQSILEQQRAVPFGTLASASPPPQNIDNIRYTPAVTVDAHPDGRLKTVRVTVAWTWKERDLTTFREAILCNVPRG